MSGTAPCWRGAGTCLLKHLGDHAPGDCRDTMIENVPLHRDIMQAWKEHG